MTTTNELKTFQLTLTVRGLPKGKERAFRLEVAGAKENFQLPYRRLGGLFDLIIQVTGRPEDARERCLQLGRDLASMAQRNGGLAKAYVFEAAFEAIF